MSTRVKVYQEVLAEIQRLIKEEGWTSGDKLPSERNLAIELDAARSSIREALRAIELLGIIETKQGEGTFLRDYKSYHTVDLLASFILQGRHTTDEIRDTKQVLERYAIQQGWQEVQREKIEQLEEVLNQRDIPSSNRHHQFFSVFFTAANNQLLFQIWRLLQNFSESREEHWYEADFYYNIVNKCKYNLDHQDIPYDNER